MSTEEFRDVARVVTSSTAARIIGGMAAVIDRAARHSAVGVVCARVRGRMAESPAVARLRLAGALLLATVVTHTVLLTLVPAFVRPASRGLLRMELLAASIVILVAAPSIVHAWPSSRLRRIVKAQ